MREKDSNLRPSGYEPDELPLLHPAIAILPRYLAKGGRVANKTGTLAATRNDAAILFGPSRTIVVAAFMREVADPLAAVHILGLIGRGAARAAGLDVPPLPFDAAAGA